MNQLQITVLPIIIGATEGANIRPLVLEGYESNGIGVATQFRDYSTGFVKPKFERAGKEQETRILSFFTTYLCIKNGENWVTLSSLEGQIVQTRELHNGHVVKDSDNIYPRKLVHGNRIRSSEITSKYSPEVNALIDASIELSGLKAANGIFDKQETSAKTLSEFALAWKDKAGESKASKSETTKERLEALIADLGI